MSQSDEGEVLKAGGPDVSRVQVGMEVTSLDGETIGKVKQTREREFLLDRPIASGLWVPFTSILALEDYTTNYRGPVQPTQVVLSVTAAHIDSQGWAHA